MGSVATIVTSLPCPFNTKLSAIALPTESPSTGVDGAIKRSAGEQYHSQASAAGPLRDLQTIVAKGNSKDHRGEFDDVVFVVDNLRASLDKIVYNGLEASHEEGHSKILIPSIRMGVMAGVVEKTPTEAVNKLGSGIAAFMKEYGSKTQLKNITFVIYGDTKTLGQLSSGLFQNSALN